MVVTFLLLPPREETVVRQPQFNVCVKVDAFSYFGNQSVDLGLLMNRATSSSVMRSPEITFPLHISVQFLQKVADNLTYAKRFAHQYELLSSAHQENLPTVGRQLAPP